MNEWTGRCGMELPGWRQKLSEKTATETDEVCWRSNGQQLGWREVIRFEECLGTKIDRTWWLIEYGGRLSDWRKVKSNFLSQRSMKCEKKSRPGKGIETVARRKKPTKVMKEEHPESRRESGQVCREAAGCRSKGAIGDPSQDFYETSNNCGMRINGLELSLFLKYYHYFLLQTQALSLTPSTW